MRIDERHTSDLLGQSTRTVVLPSGLTVQMCRMPGFVTAYAMLTVGVGSIDTGYRVRGREVRLPAGWRIIWNTRCSTAPTETPCSALTHWALPPMPLPALIRRPTTLAVPKTFPRRWRCCWTL